MNSATLSPPVRKSAPARTPQPSTSRVDVPREGAISRVWRRAVLGKLQDIEEGCLTVVEGASHSQFGETGKDALSAAIAVHNPRFYRQIALAGSLGAAESYLDKDWDCDDLTALIRILARNLEATTAFDGRLTAAARRIARWKHALSQNSRRGSRKNIEAHYDLGDDFFRLFLDPTMMYSSATFERPGMSLEEAQLARLEHICRKLDLRPSDHVVEIGTGWGGFALYAAQQYGCRVTTTTISQNQYDCACARVQAAGLSDRVTVLKQDYRDLEGRYDKLVSIEMIEAVGHEYYDTFFGKCARLLKPGGKMLLQAIVMPEQRYASYLRSVDFIQKYIFPGGCLPSIAAMQDSVARTSNLRLLALDDFAADYAQTLREWRARFHARLDDVRALGYTERFIRMWHYYLCYCEAAFDERAVGVVHAVWGR